MELKISKQSRAGHTLVSICGELDLYTAPLLRVELTAAVVPRTRTVVDMSEVEFCDSTGLSVLLSALKQARRSGGELELAAPRPPVRRILQITGLDEVFTIHRTADVPASDATGAAN